VTSYLDRREIDIIEWKKWSLILYGEQRVIVFDEFG